MLVGVFRGVWVIEYRRGVTKRIWGRLWHFHDQCSSYPTQSFAIRKDRPDEDELCARCAALAHGR
jgi:hypothetical protein